ncbi:hypothetical protein OQA88_5138 [Cercophora sp. LCS_1]
MSTESSTPATSEPPSACSTPAPPSKANPKNKQAQNRPPKPPPPPKKTIRILMLHGYTQSGPLFRAKTRALEKLLVKSLAPLNLVPALIYPTAPNRLSPHDIPGFEASEEKSDEETDAWAWFRKDEATGSYRLLEEGMDRISETIKAEGGVDGVVGFSQGGCMAAMVASALEKGREVPSGWGERLREANGGREMKFAVVYSGFWAVPADLAWLWEPKVKTPTLHFIGGLDTVVEESRCRGLVERCEDAVAVVHPGGHYVPISKEWVGVLAGFVRKYVEEEKN